MAPGRSDDFLRRRSNEDRAQDYRSITQCLWKPYSDHKTNSTVAVARYKSHSLCLSMRTYKMCSRNKPLFSSEKKTKRGHRVWWYISCSLTSSPMGAVFVCLCVYLCLFGCLVSECSLDRGGFTPLGKTARAERSDKVTSATISEWTHINMLTHGVDAQKRKMRVTC